MKNEFEKKKIIGNGNKHKDKVVSIGKAAFFAKINGKLNFKFKILKKSFKGSFTYCVRREGGGVEDFASY